MFRHGMCRYVSIGLAALCCLSLLACSNSRQDPDDTLRVYSRLWTPLREQSFIREVILPRFTEGQGVPVELVLYTDNDLNAMVRADNLDGVDLVIPYGRDLPLWVEEARLLNIVDYSRDWPKRTFIAGINPWQNDGFVSRFLPIGADVYLLIAAREALRYLPVGADTRQLSWEETAAWVEQASAAEERGLFALAGVPLKSLIYVISGMVLSYGGGFPDLNSDAALQALALFHSMYSGIHPDSAQFDSVIDPLLRGDAWFAFAHCARAGAVVKEAPDMFTTFLAPSGPAGRGSVGGVSGLGVLDDSDSPVAALALAEFLTRPSVQVAVSRGVGGFLPTVREAEDFLESDPLDHVIRSGLTVLLEGRIRGIPEDITEWGNAKQVYETLFFDSIVKGETIPAEVLNAAQADLDSLRSGRP